MLDVSQLPLPESAHIPGRNKRPDPAFLEEFCELADPVTTDLGSGDNLPWVYGIRLFNHGFYWEAHEVWEAVWMKAPLNSRERQFVQGMIHFANGLLKIRMEMPGAAHRLFDLANQCINNALPHNPPGGQEHFMAVNLTRLRGALHFARQPNSQQGVDNCVNYEL